MILKGISKNVRFQLVDSTDLVNEIIKRTNIKPIFFSDVAKITNMAIILSETSKNARVSVSLKSDNAALSSVIARTTSNGNLAINVNVDEEKYTSLLEAINKNDEENIKKLYNMLDSKLVIQTGFDKKYTSIIVVKDNLLELAMNEYFEKSEQTKTIFICYMKYSENLNCKVSSSLFIQLLPNSDERILEKLADKISRLTDLTEMIDNGFSLEKIAYLLFEDDLEIYINEEKYKDLPYDKMPLFEDIKILDVKDIKYECDCSNSYMKNVLKKYLDKNEFQEILDEKGHVEIICNFCNEKYKFKNLKEIYGK